MAGPLAGITVLELSRVSPGSYDGARQVSAEIVTRLAQSPQDVHRPLTRLESDGEEVESGKVMQGLLSLGDRHIMMLSILG